MHGRRDQNTPFTIAVAGGSGSGKTTIAQAIIERIGAEHIAYLPHDAYYYDLTHYDAHQRQQFNFDHPNSLDTDLMIEHIRSLQASEAVEVPIYDFTNDRRTEQTITVLPNPIILVEGILILWEAELRPLFDIKIFVDTDADIRFIRRLKRDISERGRSVDSVINQYIGTVRPMHMEFVEPSRRHADVIIPEGGYNTAAIDMVADRIRAMINRQQHTTQALPS
ncbi:MAG: uridine kinase [Armatimonadetes bacterium]|nr:uridine kinase [Anaerolineae bacterium]